MKWIPLILLSISLSAGAQLLIKRVVVGAGDGGPASVIYRSLTAPLLWVAVLGYIASFLTWLIVLSKVQLSYAGPMAAFGYVIIVAASAMLWHEHVSWVRWLAVIIICGGVALLAKS